MSDFHFGIEEREHYSAAEIAARSNSWRKTLWFYNEYTNVL